MARHFERLVMAWGWPPVIGALVALLAGVVTCGSARAEDPPGPPPSVFEMTRPAAPSAEKAMSDAIRERAIGAPLPATSDKQCAHPPIAALKKRLSLATALKNACASGHTEQEAVPAPDNAPPPDR